MKQTQAFLASLVVNAIVLFAQDDEAPEQHAIVSIARASAEEPITVDTQVELQPEHGPTLWVRAGDLTPVARARVRIEVEVDFMLGLTPLEDLIELLEGNIKASINQGMLTTDADATVEYHDIDVSGGELERLFTSEQREQVIDRLVEDMLDGLAQSDDYPKAVCLNGHRGYKTMSDNDLRTQFIDNIGPLEDSFDWAEEQDEEEEEA